MRICVPSLFRVNHDHHENLRSLPFLTKIKKALNKRLLKYCKSKNLELRTIQLLRIGIARFFDVDQ
jgi:hypothetical protein